MADNKPNNTQIPSVDIKPAVQGLPQNVPGVSRPLDSRPRAMREHEELQGRAGGQVDRMQKRSLWDKLSKLRPTRVPRSEKVLPPGLNKKTGEYVMNREEAMWYNKHSKSMVAHVVGGMAAPNLLAWGLQRKTRIPFTYCIFNRPYLFYGALTILGTYAGGMLGLYSAVQDLVQIEDSSLAQDMRIFVTRYDRK